MDNFHAVFEIKGNLTRILFTNRADGNTVRAGYNRLRYKLRGIYVFAKMLFLSN